MEQASNANAADDTAQDVTTETNLELVSTDSAQTTDTESATDTSAIEEGEASTSQGDESTDTTSQDEELFYDIDGEEVSLNQVREWKKGHMLEADYTRKRQADAEKSRTLDAQIEQVEQVKSVLSERLTEAEAIISELSNPEDLAELRDTDPSEYLKRQEEIKIRKERLANAKQEMAKVEEDQERARIQSEQKALAEALPEWADPKKQEADISMIDEYAKQHNFSADDVKAITNHRLMITVLDAAKYHKLKAKVEQTKSQVDKAPNVIKARTKTETKKALSDSELFYGKK